MIPPDPIPAAPTDRPRGPVSDILAQIAPLTRAPQVTLGQIFEVTGEASFAPALMIPALIVVSPLSGIFFLPTVMGLTVALIAGQMLIGRRRLWLPGVVLHRSLSGARVARTLDRLDPLAAWLDRHTRRRLDVLLRLPLSAAIPVGSLLSGLMMPLLELVPLSSSILGAAITCFALASLARDGLYVIWGLGLMALASLIPLAMVAGLF